MKGLSLSESMHSSGQFSPFETVSVSVGENTGRLIEVLKRLSQTLERNRDLKRQLIAVSTYPVLLVGLTFGVLVFMLFFVVPTFQDLYQRFNAELPTLTRGIISLSKLVNIYSILGFTLVSIGIIYFISKNKDTLGVRRLQSKTFGLIPIFGTLWRENILSQYFDFFSLMLSSGIPINNVLEYLQNLTYAYPLKEETKSIGREIELGKSLNEAMNEASFFNPGIIALIKIGEESNRLDEVFDNLREQYTKKSEFSLKTFGAAIEPVLIVVIAAIVAVILLAMYLPIFEFSAGI
jgi:type IV pilus assembly protein PilC